MGSPSTPSSTSAATSPPNCAPLSNSAPHRTSAASNAPRRAAPAATASSGTTSIPSPTTDPPASGTSNQNAGPTTKTRPNPTASPDSSTAKSKLPDKPSERSERNAGHRQRVEREDRSSALQSDGKYSGVRKTWRIGHSTHAPRRVIVSPC